MVTVVHLLPPPRIHTRAIKAMWWQLRGFLLVGCRQPRLLIGRDQMSSAPTWNRCNPMKSDCINFNALLGSKLTVALCVFILYQWIIMKMKTRWFETLMHLKQEWFDTEIVVKEILFFSSSNFNTYSKIIPISLIFLWLSNLLCKCNLWSTFREGWL